MKQTVELDMDDIDKIAVLSLRNSVDTIKRLMPSDAARFDKEHHRQNMRDYFKTLEALEHLIWYYTGVEDET